MPEFKNLNTDAGLANLNTHLSTRSYIDGFRPSQADNCLLDQLTASVNHNKFPHVYRWLSHIQTFPPCTRARWTGVKCPSEEKKCPATGKSGACPASKSAPAAAADDEDDDFSMDLDDDDADGEDTASALIARKNAEKEAAKKASKANQDTSKMGKSTLVLDIKPEDSETNLDDLEAEVRKITMDGLLWGSSERVPIAYGIQKLRLGCVVIDELVSIDELQENIDEIEGVQSNDIAAFNKI